MLAAPSRLTLLAVPLLAGLPWLRSGSAVPPATATAPQAATKTAADRVVLLPIDDPEYRAYAIPRSYKTAPEAPMHVLVFRGGLCIRDLGIAETLTEDEGGHGTGGAAVVEQAGSTARAFVAADGRTAAVVRTTYVSRVDVTPGQSSTANDTVTGGTTVTLVDPEHPDGRWSVTLENSRWVRDVLVLPASKGIALTTFRPRTGPTDFRVLDATGRESLHVPESSAVSIRMESSPEGGHVAAEVTFRENEQLPERGVMVFELSRGTHWTYSWRYGTDAEPVSWTLQSQGILAVTLPGATLRFDATGRKL